MFESKIQPKPLPQPAPIVAAAQALKPEREALARELRRRQDLPQRHRLLQGYPMVPLMRPAGDPVALESFPVDRRRKLIVGVLPHPFCNPRVQGCGFCTFPHEAYRGADARAVTASVAREVELRSERLGLLGRRVDGLYFGGGTANLTPPDAFADLCKAVGWTYDLTDAEVTLEGVPAYFLARKQALLDVLADLPARTRRLSMGVQTFDPVQVASMGREAFGDADTVARVIEAARARDMTTSADLLLNLPDHTRADTLADVRQAVDLGLDQVCVYQLVLYAGLGTEWSRDPAKLAAQPGQEEAYATWRSVRALLLDAGYVQSTLTNFERAEVAASERRFAYEVASFTPEAYDGIGFGPAGISTFTDPSGLRARKVINQEGSAAYRRGIEEEGHAYALHFDYRTEDMRLLHLTRSLARLRVDRQAYARTFGTDAVADHAQAWEALGEAGLVEVDPAAVRLTERGMYYADTVAGLLAWRRARALREGGVGRRPRRLPVNETGQHFMG
jgi:oxygen-independent coproporphyrinogen-3 oxidase